MEGMKGGEQLLSRVRRGKEVEYRLRVEDSDKCGQQGRVVVVRLQPYE